jgi:hypothetical protein
VIQEEDEEE